MPATIYSRLNDRDFVYSRNDLRKIAYWTHEKYLEAYGKDPDKIEQEEDDQTFQVFVYPDEWIETIDEVTDWYFKKKRKIGEQHIKRELKAKAMKEAREKHAADLKENANKPKGKGNPNPNQKGKGRPNQNQGNRNPNQKNKGNNPNPNNRFQKSAKPNPNQKSNPNQKNNPNQKAKPSYNKNYSNRFGTPNQNQGVRRNDNNDRISFNSYNNDVGADYNNSGSKSSYVGVSSEHKFSHKVELDKNSDDGKKRKRIAKALYVAAPIIEDNDNE